MNSILFDLLIKVLKAIFLFGHCTLPSWIDSTRTSFWIRKFHWDSQLEENSFRKNKKGKHAIWFSFLSRPFIIVHSIDLTVDEFAANGICNHKSAAISGANLLPTATQPRSNFHSNQQRNPPVESTKSWPAQLWGSNQSGQRQLPQALARLVSESVEANRRDLQDLLSDDVRHVQRGLLDSLFTPRGSARQPDQEMKSSVSISRISNLREPLWVTG